MVKQDTQFPIGYIFVDITVKCSTGIKLSIKVDM